MIGLAVYLNGKKLTVAGSDDLGVLNAIVNAVGRLGNSTAPFGKGKTRDLWLSVGGLTRRPEETENEHLRWIRHRRLRVGDKVTVKMVLTEKPNRHTGATVARSGPEAKMRAQSLMRVVRNEQRSKRPRRSSTKL